MISGQKAILFLQSVHQIGQFLNDTLIRAEVFLLREHNTEIEDKFISIVAEGLHANRVAQNAVAIGAHLDEVAAELLAGNHEEGHVGEGKEGRLRRCRAGGNDGSIRDLVNDLGACEDVGEVRHSWVNCTEPRLAGVPSCVSNLL